MHLSATEPEEEGKKAFHLYLRERVSVDRPTCPLVKALPNFTARVSGESKFGVSDVLARFVYVY